MRTVMVAVALAVLAAGCAADDPEGGRGLVRVVTTVSPITNIVQNVGGPHVQVTGIVPEGTDSHTFEPAPSDAEAFGDADVVFVNGLHLEDPTMALAEANVPEAAPIVELAPRTIEPDEYIYDFSFPRSGGDPNPHLWTDPLYAGRFASIIGEELAGIDPANAADYRANATAFRERVDELDEVIRDVTRTVPPENRALLTYHDSFPYFAREYGWRIVGAVQPADFAEPTPQEVASLIDQIRAEGVPAIFGSEVFPSPVLQQIADETGATYVAELRDDDLPGENGDADHSYFGLIVFDLETFMGSLGGDVAAFGSFDVTNLQPGATVDYRY